jgi:hypothetical protein
MLSLFLSAFLLQTHAAPAQPNLTLTLDCSRVDVSPTGALAPWNTPAPAAVVLRPGTAVPVTPGQDVSLEIANAGTYGMALATGAWIDVTQNGRALRSTDHAHGPACSGIHKIVDFQLATGRYTIRLSRTEATSVRLLVFRK